MIFFWEVEVEGGATSPQANEMDSAAEVEE